MFNRKMGKELDHVKLNLFVKQMPHLLVGDIMMLILVKKQMADGTSMKKNFLLII